ncbi:MAG: hypothetical protein ACI8P0_003063 [Planctomycetaceae bacterium]|jgi:hypothetical protein
MTKPLNPQTTDRLDESQRSLLRALGFEVPEAVDALTNEEAPAESDPPSQQQTDDLSSESTGTPS